MTNRLRNPISPHISASAECVDAPCLSDPAASVGSGALGRPGGSVAMRDSTDVM